MVYELLCNLIGPSASRLSLHILLVVKKKMTERFAKMNEQEIRELLDNQANTKNTVFVYIIK